MKSVMIAMILALVLSIVGWYFYGKATEKMAKERQVLTPEQLYDKEKRAEYSKTDKYKKEMYKQL